MAMFQQAEHSDGLQSEINITPLVDVMLVLLVIFMVTAPLMKANITVDLPSAAHTDQAAPPLSPTKPVVLTIDNKKRVTVDGVSVSWSQLDTYLQQQNTTPDIPPTQSAAKTLHLEADQALPYAIVIAAMSAAKQSGFDQVQLMTKEGTASSWKQIAKSHEIPL